MGRCRKVFIAAALGLLAFVGSIFAMDVPLTYHVAELNAGGFPGGTAWLQLSAKPPDGTWKLPVLKSKFPLFCQITLGESKMLCILDRKQESNPFYDLMYLDVNGNRDLTDDKGISGDFKKQSATFADTTFKPVNVEILAGGTRFPYAFAPRVYSGAFDRLGGSSVTADTFLRNVYFYINSSCYYTGTVALDGASYNMMLSDSNCDGLFSSRLSIAQSSYADHRLPIEGDWFCLYQGQNFDYSSMLRLGRYLTVGSSLFELSVDMPGKKLQLTPVNGGVNASLPLPTQKLELVSKDASLSVMAYACKDVVRVPPGQYKVAWYRIRDKDKWGDTWQLEAMGSDSDSYPELKTSGPAALVYGPPFAPTVSVYDWVRQDVIAGKRKDVGLNFTVIGKAGEVITDLGRIEGNKTQIPMSKKNSYRPAEPTYLVLKTSGEIVAKGAFEYG